MSAADPAERSTDQPQGPGETLVRLLGCVDELTTRVERQLPSVDHLALRRKPPDPGAVVATLNASGLGDLVEPFESWRRLLDDFDLAVARLSRLRDGPPAPQGRYQHDLGVLIGEARRCRRAVQEATDDLRRRVASHIDIALAHADAG